MRPTDPDERIPVRVTYVSRGHGLSLTISDDDKSDEADDGFLTVVESGVTTLELRRPDGGSSYLIWDESEVAWDSLRAG